MNYNLLKIGLINAVKSSSKKLDYNDIRLIINAHFSDIIRSVATKERQKELEEELEKSRKREKEQNAKP